MTKKIKITLIAIACILSYMAGDYIAGKAAKHEKREEIREVIKYRDRTKTITKIIERPDGTKETIIKEDKDVSNDIDKARKLLEIVTNKPGYSVSLSAGLSGDFKINPIYTLGVDRRVFSGLFAGLYGRTDGEFGVSLRYEF